MLTSNDTFHILFVCHANLCRSPLAELMARDAFGRAFGAASARVTVASAGTHAFAGSPMHAGSARVLAEMGVDPEGFASRVINPSMLASADLVLAAGREQRAACVTMAPGTVRRTFTIRQFTRFAAAVPPGGPGSPAERLTALMANVNAMRHLVQPLPAHEEDLPDPVQQPIEAFRECADELRRSLSVITGVVAVS